MKMDAEISECGQYRYFLSRVWDESKPGVLWIMLNPSTADHVENDNTIRRCITFSQDLGAGHLGVVNLFALRSKNPDDLKIAEDPVGPENDKAILAKLNEYTTIIAGWGTKGSYLGRNQQVIDLIKSNTTLHCLKRTKHGHPQHPLYVPRKIDLIEL